MDLANADAVLALLFDPQVCDTCGGTGHIDKFGEPCATSAIPCPNPACVDGVVPSRAVWRSESTYTPYLGDDTSL